MHSKALTEMRISERGYTSYSKLLSNDGERFDQSFVVVNLMSPPLTAPLILQDVTTPVAHL
jgi:hypothetical protein